MFASGKTAAVASAANYIEDVFSTYLWTGDGASGQTINNGIDLSGKGGLMWMKPRTSTSGYSAYWNRNQLYDTVRGIDQLLSSNTTDAQGTVGNLVTSVTSTGFTIGAAGPLDFASVNYASWTFRKQPKFFDVVTYTGNGANRTIAHSLGSVPACMIIKDCTNAGSAWAVYHTSLGNTQYLQLQSTGAAATSSGYWNNTTPTSTEFTVGTNGNVNQSGATYIAYLFAHNAGGFGLTGTDNVISCGSVTLNSSGAGTVNLGYEPQWVLMKTSSSANDWIIFDTMRGFSVTGGSGYNTLNPNLSAAEFSGSSTYFQLTNTGFSINMNFAGWQNENLIYIAIRRGPMKVPTSGTSVFSPVAQAGNGGNDTVTTGFTTDLVIGGSRTANPIQGAVDRLRGRVALLTANTAAEDPCPSGRDLTSFASNTGFTLGYPPFATSFNYTGNNIYWNFRRAPSFFDEVCWTRSTTTATLNHNLGVVPELIIKKDRSRAGTYWDVMPNVSPYDYRYDIYLNDTQAISGPSSIYWNAAPTATTFDVHMGFDGSSNGDTFVAYLFATCAGVSKVGSYTGTGTTLQVDCGFTGGARFVLIKRTDSTGDWYVWDTARGIVSGNDPYLLLNSTAAETTGTDYIDTYSAGFEISSTAPAAINASGGTFIFLAIA